MMVGGLSRGAATMAGTTVRILRDGPALAEGDLVFAREDGTVVRREARAALCRCGQSGRKPFCDGTHRKVGFADPPGPAPDPGTRVQPPPGDADREGPVTVVLKPEGSLRLVGPVTVVTAEGRRHLGGRVSLCRCGASREKPWCDNAHREIGFRADV
jgi:CDGSH-type Zn-finger protein